MINKVGLLAPFALVAIVMTACGGSPTSGGNENGAEEGTIDSQLSADPNPWSPPPFRAQGLPCSRFLNEYRACTSRFPGILMRCDVAHRCIQCDDIVRLYNRSCRGWHSSGGERREEAGAHGEEGTSGDTFGEGGASPR